jgi:hypothetical protein
MAPSDEKVSLPSKKSCSAMKNSVSGLEKCECLAKTLPPQYSISRVGHEMSAPGCDKFGVIQL